MVPSDVEPIVVEVTESAPEDAAPAPRIDAIEAIENVDLEAPGALEKALAARARASDKELMVLAVGDTRDHRRMHKDPALSQVSVDFAINLVENLAALGLRNYLMLTSSAQLCDELRRDADVDGCAHSSHLTDREKELQRWGLKPGDMFLLWAQQWRVVQRALEAGYSVMRVDSDVVFLEDPYLALRGPLLSPFAMVSQTDVFDLGTRPRCDADTGVTNEPGHPDVKRCDSSSLKSQPQLNIGLVYFRRSAMADDGPTLGVIKDMLNAFTAKLLGDVQVNDDGNPIAEALLDQPLFREAVSTRVRRGSGWKVASGSSGEVYASIGSDGDASDGDASDGAAVGDECPHARTTCDAIAAERRRTDIAFASLGEGEWSELAAGAPDWLFGRGCVKTVADAPRALAHLRSIRSTNAPASIDGSGENGTCETRAGVVNRAPGVGGVGGGVVAVHMVYSKARKRADAMEAMGWWRASVRRPGGGRGGGEVGGAEEEAGMAKKDGEEGEQSPSEVASASAGGPLPRATVRWTAASAAMGLACSSRTRTFGRTRRALGRLCARGHPHRHVPVLRARSRRGWRGSVVGAERGERGRARRAVAGGPRGCVDGAEAGGPHRDRAGLRDAPERRVERVLGQVKGRDAVVSNGSSCRGGDACVCIGTYGS